MDLQMPGMSGIDAIAAIRSEFPDARIVVLTAHRGDVQILRALKAGLVRIETSSSPSWIASVALTSPDRTLAS